MNIEDMVQKARSLLTEMQDAIDKDDNDTAEAKLEEYNTLKAKIDIAQAHAGAVSDLDDVQIPAKKAKKEQEPVDEPGEKTFRPPFDVDDDKDVVPEPDDSFSKSVNVLKYGELPAAQKAVLTDLYGLSYQQMRYDQTAAFSKYLRMGEHRLSLADEKLLKQIIVRPEDIVGEIQKGTSLSEMKVTLQEGIDDLGGYLVPEDYRAEIIKRMMGLTVVRSRARVVNTIRDSAEWPKLEGGNSQYTSAVRVTWVDEIPSSATVAQTNPTFGMYRIPVHTAMARTDLSRNLVEDSAFNMLSLTAELFAEAMAIDEDQKFLTGTGGGTPRGILGNRSGANETPETGISSVSSGAAAALTADGLVDLVYNLHSQYRTGAVLVAARATHGAIRKLKDGNGDYLWQRGLAAGEPPTLLSYPFLESESMPAIGANNYPVIFGNLNGYLLVDRVGMSVERVEDTTTKGTNTIALFARRRLGGQVVEPWKFQGHKVSA